MHSAPAEVIPEPESPIDPGTRPEQLRDDESRPRKLRGWLIGIAVAAVVLLPIILALVTRTRPTGPGNQTAGRGRTPGDDSRPGEGESRRTSSAPRPQSRHARHRQGTRSL